MSFVLVYKSELTSYATNLKRIRTHKITVYIMGVKKKTVNFN